MSDLKERVEKYYDALRTCDPNRQYCNPDDDLKLMEEVIAALSPALPDEVAELAAWLDEYTADDPMHSAVNSHYKLRRILKMLERQALEIATLQAQVKELEGRLAIVDCEHEWFAACGPNQEGIKTCNKCGYQPAALQENE